ncbi:MAG: VOC family protein [Microthrixaceae bacterium]
MAATNLQLTTIDLGDPADPWRAAGFLVHDGPRGAEVRLGSTVLRLTGRGGRVLAWALEGASGDLDGLASTTAATVGGASPEHPNGISRIDHVVVQSGDVERTVEAFSGAGLEVRRERSTTSYGSPMRQVFFWAGDVILELIGPDKGEPVTDQATSVFGLALVADDLDATAEHLGELLSPPKDAVQKRRRIAGLRGAQVGITIPIAVMSPHEPIEETTGNANK